MKVTRLTQSWLRSSRCESDLASTMTVARKSAQIALLLTVLATAAFAQSTVRVDATPGHAINAFDPDSALGSSIDVLSRTDINRVYTPHIIQEALSAATTPSCVWPPGIGRRM